VYKVLVVDDQDDVRDTLIGTLKDSNYAVEAASTPEKALDSFILSGFDFAIVDVRLFGGNDDDISGLTLAMSFKQLRPDVGIIILTAYEPTDLTKRALRYFGILKFIEKTPDLDREVLGVLHNAQEKLQKRLRTDQKDPDTYLMVSIHDHASISVHSRGRHVYSGYGEGLFNLNDKHSRRANSLLRNQDDWRILAKDLGNDLWKEVFVNCDEVMRAFSEARTKSQRFSIIFETAREGLGLPLEFVRLRNPDEHLALRHPITRFISGISPKREAISPKLLALTKSLNVLIIASNTQPDIPGVDIECQKLHHFINSKEIQNFIPVHADYIPTEEATFERICDELSKSKYDIIHYAGHGNYDNNLSENSSLYFWNEKGKKGGIREMKTTELTDLLLNSETRLLYLSCCFGAVSGHGYNPNDDFLGLADAAIQAGIPSVLGFRAPVLDSSAIDLAKQFYANLFERGRLDIALWEARRYLARSNRNDPTWLSPILISQH
jgi:CheY-like chemotaxis protein